MKKLQKRYTSIILILFILLAIPCTTLAMDIQAKGAVLINGSTGEIMYEKNGSQMMVPASLTKLMTLYITFDQIAKGNASMDTRVKISAETSAFSKNRNYSNVPLQTGQTYSLQNLISSIITVSACASSKAVAEHFAGSEAAFAAQMNQYAKDLGLTANFVDSSGASPENKISPISMAKLSQRLVMDFPQILDFSKKSVIEFENKKYFSTNKMLLGMPYAYEGLDGLKTGSLSAAKYCFVGTAKRNDVRLIAVIMGEANKNYRFEETKQLLDYGFAQNPSSQKPATGKKVLVNGIEQQPSLYLINDRTYFKLRDLAYMLKDTNDKFAVEWLPEQSAIALNPSQPYEPIGGEMAPTSNPSAQKVEVTTTLFVNENPVTLNAYNINGNNYFQLQELAPLLNFEANWDSQNNAIEIIAN